MDRTRFRFPFFSSLIITLLLFALLDCSTATDNSTITSTQYITDPQTITSSGKIFQLGFFNLGTSHNRYVGIWYNNLTDRNVVWVANRDYPITDSSGVAKIADDGNLVILDGEGILHWSTNVSNVPVVNNRSSVIAELLDTGNLVLRQKIGDRKILWQSFDFPTNTLLPTMKIGFNRRTGENIGLWSWRSPSDPSFGDYYVGIDDLIDINIIQLVLLRDSSDRIWRSGPWNNNDSFLGTSLPGLNVIRDPQEDSVLDESGVFFYKSEQGWAGAPSFFGTDTVTSGLCTVNNKCPHNTICNEQNPDDGRLCTCVYKYWSIPADSSPCKREKEFQCERNRNRNRNSSSSASTNSNNEAGNEKDADEFIRLNNITLPDFPIWIGGPNNSEACAKECLKNCSCLAYSYPVGIGCMTWGGSLIDVVRDGLPRPETLYIRRAHTESPSFAPVTAPVKKRNKQNLIIIPVVIGTFTIIVCTYFCWRWLAKKRGRYRRSMEIPINVDNKEPSDPHMLGDNTDLKIFKFENVVTATNNFSGTNKLGEGGFGPVYKGIFADDGQEIAVKRLCKCSLQGFEEFKNEVLVILKLQHRNLVRLLGCCMEGEERLLIYEYMPNKSLDAFIFDSKKQALLDWRKRFQIIEGICRGIIYLHRDSRLRVIHRDLKASNILLDEELNPKISDFGMARIFGSNELQANTRRVVGTYGYMSPEYAMDGLFSEKSDVFSFGVLLLEIVSGKRNTSFYNHELSSSLLGYAWKLWNDNQTQLLIDPTLLSQPNFELEILRCIHVGLLCVQDSAKDRPTMYTALSMLISEISSLPTPKQPAFTDRRVSSDSNPSQINQINACSLNNLTISNVEGR